MAARNQSVALDAIVGEVAARFFDRALQSNIDLGIDVTPASILADPSLLDDLVSNLVDNALKYTPSGGTVTVSVGIDQGKPYLAVEDTGIGIPESEFPEGAPALLSHTELSRTRQRLGTGHRRGNRTDSRCDVRTGTGDDRPGHSSDAEIFLRR
jgi:signal transduction histidine kinase